MSYAYLKEIKHRISLSGQEIALLRDRLVPISPMEYDLSDYASLRHLYGRFDRITCQDEPINFVKKGG